MTKRTKHTVDIDLTTAAELIGVDRSALIAALHDNFHLSRNNRLDNIAGSAMVKLGYFINDLRRLNNQSSQRVYELPLVTVWGMQFLRDFCKDKKIKPAKEQPQLVKPEQMSVGAQIQREKLKDMAAHL